MTVLPSGSALGFGNGPLLLASRPETNPHIQDQLTLCPGEFTTANLLFCLFHANTTRVEHVVFSEIMPRLQRGEADFGVCIHEGRFTWESEGLFCIEDLGQRWESESGCPLPLGGIMARRALGNEVLARVQAVLRDSLRIAGSNPAATLPTMRQYAQEFNDQVLMQHVELYVNQWTLELGHEGAAALTELSRRAAAIGLIKDTAPPLEIFSFS